MAKSNSGISIIESLVCIVIIGIGFIAIMQLSAFSINSMDRATERNKLNYLSEMVIEDMIGDPDNVSKYGNFNKTCSSGNQNASDLHTRMKKKWDDKLQEKNLHISVFDPVTMDEAKKLLKNIEFATSIEDCINNSDALVILTEWNEFRSLSPERLEKHMKGNILIDLRNALNPYSFRESGFNLIQIGRPYLPTP